LNATATSLSDVRKAVASFQTMFANQISEWPETAAVG
jgi:hypothetical protein